MTNIKRNRPKPRGVLRALFILYRVLRVLLILAVVIAIAAAGWLYFKYRSGERGIRKPVPKIDLPTAAASYVPTEDDPYFALYGKSPLDTPAPTKTPDITPEPVPTQIMTPFPTQTQAQAATPAAQSSAAPRPTEVEMETIPPAATIEPTPSPTPEPTPTPLPAVDAAFTFAEEVTYGGETYRYNPNIVSILFLGIDEQGKVKVRTEGFGKGNQTDVILLAAIDADKKVVTLLNISRDTMTNVDILSYDHKTIVGRRVMQVALSHAYGDGADLSCALAADAVGELIGGLPINGYAALNYGALGILNDAVGGVSVTLDEDMTISGKEYKAGDVVSLKGDMTADYIRSRTGVGNGTNAERMGRQEGYIKGFIGRCLSSGRNPAKLVLDLYHAADEYTVTGLSQDEIVYLGATVLSGGWTVEIQSVPGELMLNDIYEFYPDQQGLSKILLDIFYTM